MRCLEPMRCAVAIVKSTEAGKADVTTGGANVTKVQHFEDDPVLFSFCSTPDIVRIATAFTGKDIKSVHTSTSVFAWKAVVEPSYSGACATRFVAMDFAFACRLLGFTSLIAAC